MCVANLKVSTQACNHRWAQLVRPCHSRNNLATCSERLKLEGWETRVDNCPFCEDDGSSSPATHRLFGGSNGSIYGGSNGSSSSGPSSPDLVGASLPPRPTRTGSMGTISSLTRQNSSTSSGEHERGQWHREMNDRLLYYMTTDPQEVLPSARRNSPTYVGLPSSGTTSGREESTTSDAASIRSASQTFSRAWKKGVRFGKLKS